jgi:hypothetical protein
VPIDSFAHDAMSPYLHHQDRRTRSQTDALLGLIAQHYLEKLK